jgi:two-component system sensor kinase FixL
MRSRARSSLLWRAVVFWVIAAALGAVLVGTVSYARLSTAFETEARTLHRILSQRVDQHDAHLTSLAAVLSSPDPSFSIVRALADAVQRFYPRISAIDVVDFTAPVPRLLFTTRDQTSTLIDPAPITSYAS